ncbi:MAG: translation elongation factor 4 [Candidatus Jorgensenbacteria bacterium]|nr:translation elongation factor 4 [Candidatus Jorgensenbacteria bacterium]
MQNIRNFVIIAHIDHGKSTLADRFLEITGTVDKRKMKAQFLDQLDLERERGITIKMAPVRMRYAIGGTEYLLNLIDTPGHSDFSYEVSRSLHAVEGAILLVDATQGIQAQTLANFRLAKAAGLTVIGAVNKVDLFEDKNDPRLRSVVDGLAKLISVKQEEILFVSGKTGKGAEELLKKVIELVPPPRQTEASDVSHARALVFDSFYDDHKGVVASVRVFDGVINSEDDIFLIATQTRSKIKEIGYFAPELRLLAKGAVIGTGEFGYVATGVRDPEKIKIGDTLVQVGAGNQKQVSLVKPLPGYKEPSPVVFVSFYPSESDEYELLEHGLEKLHLNDSALLIEPDQNEVLGRGFKVGFLGRLHFEITSERLRREFHVETVNTFPSVLYKIKTPSGWKEIVKPEDLPAEYEEILEPIIAIDIILPQENLSDIMALQKTFRMSGVTTETIGDRLQFSTKMPLAELVSDFDDQLKSATHGLASFSYELVGYEKADVVRTDILVSHEILPGLSRFFPRDSVEREARAMVAKLKKLLPRQQFNQPIQAQADGRIIARDDIAALRKDVTDYLYGGDRTRKMKLWKKQQRGKKRLNARAEVHIAPETFKELLKK